MGKGGRPFDGEKMEMMVYGCEAEVIPEIQVLGTPARQAPAGGVKARTRGAAPRLKDITAPDNYSAPQYSINFSINISLSQTALTREQYMESSSYLVLTLDQTAVMKVLSLGVSPAPPPC